MPARMGPLCAPLQLSSGIEALVASKRLIDKACTLESPERWRGISRKSYRQILEARATLRRLEEALQLLDRCFTGVRRVERS